MAYPEVIIPPSVKPESPSEPQLIDDETTLFQPRFGRGTTQRQLWADPLWGWRLRYRGLASADRALIRQAILEARGKAVNIRVTPGLPLRGSFPATELLTNNDFSNGTTGWMAQASTLSVADRVLRVTPTAGGGTQPGAYQSQSVTQYAPYVGRGFGQQISSRGSRLSLYFTDGVANASAAGSSSRTAGFVTSATPLQFFPSYISDSTWDVTDVVETRYASLSRCIPVDNGPNALTYSDQIDNAAWTKNASTVTANVSAAPDGTSTADSILEAATTASHYVAQTVSASSSNGDYCLTVALKANVRSHAWIRVGSAGGYAETYINLSTGALGTASVSGTWTNSRAFSVALGGGWYAVAIVGRKANSDTSVYAYIGSATSDGVNTFLGSTSAGVVAWRATLSQSSVPARLVQTTSAATTGAAQTGSTLYVKGLPVSTSGLLLTGDFIEINGELKQVTASLDSDAAGLGVLKFRPGLWVSPADNDPIIVNNPMGRFRLASDPRITENFGLYTDVELDLIEAGP